MKIGEQIKKLRNLNKLTQIQLAEQSNITQHYLSDIERSKKKPSIEAHEKICKALGLTLAEFYLLDEYEDAEYNIVSVFQQELKEIGIEYIALAKEIKNKKIPPEVVKKLLEAFTSLN